MSQVKTIAHISIAVIDALALSCPVGTPIYLGDSNIEHMKARHPADYAKYHTYIADILTAPDYVCVNKKDDSIEYVREFQIDNDEFVKVAVRVANSGRYYARSLYVLNTRRVQNFIAKGTLKPLTKRGK